MLSLLDRDFQAKDSILTIDKIRKQFIKYNFNDYILRDKYISDLRRNNIYLKFSDEKFNHCVIDFDERTGEVFYDTDLMVITSMVEFDDIYNWKEFFESFEKFYSYFSNECFLFMCNLNLN